MEKKENNINIEKVNLVITKIREGLSGNEISKTYKISNNEIKAILEYLKETDLALYQEICQKKEENALRIKRETGKKNKNGIIINKKPTNSLYFNPNNSIFKDYNSATINEIILMALTFRPSVESLAKILKTTTEDIFHLFDINDNYRSACFHLHYETRNLKVLDEKTDLITFTNALDYWIARTRLINLLNKYKDNKNQTIIKNKLKNLHREIDDSIFNEAKAKHFNNLTLEEARAVAQFRVKYNLSWKRIDKMGLDREKLLKLEKELASQDVIFRNQLEFLNDSNQYQKNVYNYNNSIKR